MSKKITKEEKKKILLNNYMKEHALEFGLEILLNVLLIVMVLYLCDGKDYVLGIVLAIFYSLGKIANEILSYKRNYIDKK